MVYVAEIMENIGFVATAVWVLTIAVSLLSEIMIASLGVGRVFLYYGLASLGCLLYLKRHMVESKGRSRQELVGLIASKQLLNGVEYERAQLHEHVENATEM